MSRLARFPAALLLLAAGALPAPEPAPPPPPPVDARHVIVVGRIDVQPALSAEELAWGKVPARHANRVSLMVDYDKRTIRTEAEEVEDELEVPLAEPFLVKLPRKNFFLVGGKILMSTHIEDDAYAYLPGGLKVEVKPDDTAVYIGSLQYFRDEFFGIEKIYIHDEYDQAVAAFEKKYGKGHTLRKSLVIPPRDIRR
jgi:hypothetical protein